MTSIKYLSDEIMAQIVGGQGDRPIRPGPELPTVIANVPEIAEDHAPVTFIERVDTAPGG